MWRRPRIAWRRAARWAAAPWRDRVFVATVVGAAAVPVFLVAAASIWSDAAADEVARRAVAGASTERNGVDVTHEVRFEPDGVARLDEEMRRAAASIDSLEPLTLATFTSPGLVTVGPPVREVGPSARLLGHDPALDRIEVVEELPDARRADGSATGVWVSTWFLERHELAIGDPIGFQTGSLDDDAWADLVAAGGPGVLRIVGTYEPLWSDDPDEPPPVGWDDVPPAVLPTYIGAFGGPNSALIVTDRATALGAGVVGEMNWTAPLEVLPDTIEAADELREQLREFERAFVERGDLSAAVAAVAAEPGRTPRLQTEYVSTHREMTRAVERLEAPLGSARGLGVVIGLGAMVPVGVFCVDRRRSEFRLLAAEGERWWRISLRVLGQLAVPIAVGASVGVGVAALGLRAVGRSDAVDWSGVPLGTVAVVAAVSAAVVAVVAGSRGAGLLRTETRLPPTTLARIALAGLVVAAAFTWFQVGRTAPVDGAEVDAAVVLLPILAMAAASLAAVGLLAASIGRTVAAGWRLPVSLRLVVRRLATGSGGLRLVATAVGLGVGLAVFAVALIATFDRVVSTKLASELGGVSTVVVLDDPAPGVLPEDTTVVRVFDAVLTPGRVQARVIAVDPATWPDAVTWRDEFGRSADEVVELLGVRSSGALAAVAVDGQRSPSVGAFGAARSVPYEVVERLPAFPGAGARAITVLIDVDALDEFGAAELGFESEAEARAAGVLLPSDRARRVIVSQSDLDTLTALLDESGIRYRDADSVTLRRDEAALVAVRSAFGYLGVLGAAAAVSALVGLGLSLSARRRARALAHVMLRSMGLSSIRRAAVTAIEVVAILVTALAAAFAVVPFVARRVAERFDPAPGVPPPIEVSIDWVPLVVLAAGSIAAIGLVVAVGELLADRRSPAEVLRDVG